MGIFWGAAVKDFLIQNWTPSWWNNAIHNLIDWLSINTFLIRPTIMTKMRYLRSRHNERKLIKYFHKDKIRTIVTGSMLS